MKEREQDSNLTTELAESVTSFMGYLFQVYILGRCDEWGLPGHRPEDRRDHVGHEPHLRQQIRGRVHQV